MPQFLKKLSVVAVAFAAVLMFATRAQAAPHVIKNLTVNSTFVYSTYAYAGQTYVFETTVNPGVDSVIHVMKGHGTWEYEVAFDDDSGPGLGSRVSYTPWPYNEPITVVVRSFSNNDAGTGTFHDYTNGYTSTNCFFGGVQLSVPNDANEFRTSKAFNGISDSVLLALGSDGHAIGGDDDGGVGYMSHVRWTFGVPFVLVGGFNSAGTVNFFANDRWDSFGGNTRDNDQDELGPELERELGICDRGTDPGCSAVYNLADSDRDGIQDTFEVFGKDDLYSPQHMAAWGADPRRKDLFVEVDWLHPDDWGPLGKWPLTQNTNPFHVYRLPNGPEVDCSPGTLGCMLNEDRVAQVFIDGSASDLRNLGGLNGVATHLDVGIPNTMNPSQPWGDFGGSAQQLWTCGPTNPDICPPMEHVRYGLFRSAMVQNGGAGQAYAIPNTYATFGRVLGGFHAIHELGHTVGLHHGGDDVTAGSDVCKPNYFSLMNYAFAGITAEQFSRWSGHVVYPTAASEYFASLPQPKGYLSGLPFMYGSHGIGDYDVDWNRSGLLNAGNGVRAGVSIPTVTLAGGGCANSEHFAETVAEAADSIATPGFARLGNSLYAAYVESGLARYRHTGFLEAPNAVQSCVGSDLTPPCSAWSTTADTIPTDLSPVRAVALAEYEGAVAIAYVASSGGTVRVRAKWASVLSPGVLGNWSVESELDSNAGAATEVSLSEVQTELGAFGYTNERAMFVFYVDSTGRHHHQVAQVAYGAFDDRGAVSSVFGGELAAGATASVVSWPSSSLGVSWNGEPNAGACGAFTAPTGQVNLWCYSKVADAWRQVLTFPVFTTARKPSLAYHVIREATGSPIGDTSTGQLWVAALNVGSGTTLRATVVVSSALSLSSPPWSTSPSPTWTTLNGEVTVSDRDYGAGSGLALLADPRVVGLRAIRTVAGQAAGTFKVQMLPFFDGAYRSSTGLRDVNDWQVMERRLCLGLRKYNLVPSAEEFCGNASTSPWGY